MNKVKVHIFFKLSDSPDGEMYHKPILYAYTEDEELAKLFRNSRNMEMFHEEVKKISYEEFIEFSKTYSGYRLLMGHFVTKNDSGSYFRSTTVPMVVTDSEEKKTYMCLDKIYSQLARHTFNPSILKTKYGRLLQSFNFNDMYLFSSFMSPTYGMMYDYDTYGSFMDEMIGEKDKIHEDSFSIFMDFYGSTIKKDRE